MVERDLAPRLRRAASGFPVVTVTGPRQSGKSTLCRAVFPRLGYANLEEPDTREFAQRDPRGFLAQYPEGAVVDEVQRCPELPSYLQGLVDADPRPGRWVLTGSQNLGVLESVSQSLAGRTAVLQLLPLARGELERFKEHPTGLDATLVTGGYPRILDRKLDPAEWLSAYVATYLERDVRSLTAVGDLVHFQRFVQLCAGRTAQLLNLAALGADAGVSQPTARAWLSILEATYIVFRLPPWHGNLGKRLVKTPKLHFYDTGLACWLLGIREPGQLTSHPLRGAIFETWVATEVLKARANRGESAGLSFYRDSHQNEVDVLVESAGAFTLIEAKAGQTMAEQMLWGMRKIGEALEPTGRVKMVAVYGGQNGHTRGDVAVTPWASLHHSRL